MSVAYRILIIKKERLNFVSLDRFYSTSHIISDSGKLRTVQFKERPIFNRKKPFYLQSICQYNIFIQVLIVTVSCWSAFC